MTRIYHRAKLCCLAKRSIIMDVSWFEVLWELFCNEPGITIRGACNNRLNQKENRHAVFEYPLYAAYLGIIRERQSVYDSCHSTICVRILGAWLETSDANTWWNPDVILRLVKSSNDKYNDYAQRYFWFVFVKWKLLLAIWVNLVYNYFK